MNNDTNTTGPVFEDLEDEKRKIDAMIFIRSWMKTLEWPSYVGSIHFSIGGTFALIFPADVSEGFPAHFQKDILRTLPIVDSSLRRVFTEKDGTTAWHGALEMHGVDEKFGLKRAIDEFPAFAVILECGRKTDCKLVSKEIMQTVWSMDCSAKARAEVAESR